MGSNDIHVQIGYYAAEYSKIELQWISRKIPFKKPYYLCSLADLAEFIKTADDGLTKPVEAGDYDGLVEVMGYLMAVKNRQTTTDEMFEPLKQTIELLKTYDQEMPEEVHMQLQVNAQTLSYLFSRFQNFYALIRTF